jgi:hypothetical protein
VCKKSLIDFQGFRRFSQAEHWTKRTAVSKKSYAVAVQQLKVF